MPLALGLRRVTLRTSSAPLAAGLGSDLVGRVLEPVEAVSPVDVTVDRDRREELALEVHRASAGIGIAVEDLRGDARRKGEGQLEGPRRVEERHRPPLATGT